MSLAVDAGNSIVTGATSAHTGLMSGTARATAHSTSSSIAAVHRGKIPPIQHRLDRYYELTHNPWYYVMNMCINELILRKEGRTRTSAAYEARISAVFFDLAHQDIKVPRAKIQHY